MRAQVAVLRTRPETVLADYGRLLRLAKYDQVLSRDQDCLLKLNLSWTKYFPACSTQPWQLEGVLHTLAEDGYDRRRLFPVENRTVVTDPRKGAVQNKWLPILARHGLDFIPLTEVEWIRYEFKSPLLKLTEIFPEGIEIPKMYVGKTVCHLPTVKCVHPDTEILLADGRLVRAEALVKEWLGRAPAQTLSDGDQVSEGEVRVVSLGEEGLGGGYATRFWRTPLTDARVWTVTTRTGRRVMTSGIHPFLTPEGWTPAGQLRPGDRIAVARRVRIEGKSQPLPRIATFGRADIEVDRGRVWATAPERTSPEFWRWMGYVVAEGDASARQGSYRISIATTDPEVRADYIALCRSLFGVSPKTRRGEIYFDALNLRPFFECLGGPSATKAIPHLLFGCPDEEIAAFVQAYFDGGGTIDRGGGVHAVAKSRRAAGHVQVLLARLGVLAFVGTTRSRAMNSRQTGGNEEDARISVYGDDVVTLAQWVRFRCAHKQRNLERLVARRKAGKRPSHWETIPVPPALFRMVRDGLGLRPESSGKAASVHRIETGSTQPTRPMLKDFVDRFSRLDAAGRFRNEIRHLKVLSSGDLAWDWVEDSREEPADVPFFYDLSVEGTRSFVGNGVVLHNTHGHSVTTGAIKNAFGGLLKEVRHHAHEFIHEVLVDLMSMQRELHPAVFAVMDGTVMGDGAGPRTMVPREGNLILAAADQVAVDAIAARLMGFDPLAIPYLRMCHERGLGVADPREIEILGDDVAGVRLGFQARRSLVIWGDQLIRRGPLRPLKKLLLHSPLMIWAPLASNVYHDLLWYPTVGRARVRAFAETGWGRLFEGY